jgi:multiple sugar transport system substrate-binding protein
MSDRRMSRRKFLQGALLGVAGAAAAACQPQTVVVKETVEVEKIVEKEKEVTRVVEKAVEAAGKKEIRILLSSWAVVEMPFDMMAREYNALHPDLEVKFETTFEGWDTKVLGQIRAGELEWSGAGIMTPFLAIVQWTETDMMQPLEEFVNVSAEEGAAEMLTDMIETVKEDASYKGHMYGIPYSFENITYQWRTDLFGEAGATETPKTWDEWYESCVALKKHLEAQGNEDIYVTALDPALWRSLGGLICCASDQPYTEEGLIDWDSDEMRDVLKFVRRLVSEGLTPPGGGETADLYDMWQRGRLAGLMSCSSRGVWAQNIFGPEKVETCRIPTIDGMPHSGSAFWGNCLTVLNGSPYPQEVTDFYIYAMGPQNVRWQQAAIKSGKTPVYNSAYDNILETDPMFNMYRWMLNMREDVEASEPVPRNTYYLIQHTAWNKWRVEFLAEGSTMTEDELIQHILEDSRAEIAKQQL